MIQGHAGSFGAAKFRKDGSNCDILNGGGRDIGILRECCTEDLVVCESGSTEKIRDSETDSCKHLLWIGIAEAAFIRSGYWGTEGGQEDDVIGVFLEDVLQSSLELCHYGGNWT